MNRNTPPTMKETDPDYETWFREEIEAALIEADDPNTEWIEDEAVEQEMDELRVELEALIEAQHK